MIEIRSFIDQKPVCTIMDKLPSLPVELRGAEKGSFPVWARRLQYVHTLRSRGKGASMISFCMTSSAPHAGASEHATLPPPAVTSFVT